MRLILDDPKAGPAISIGVGITVGLLAAFIQSLGQKPPTPPLLSFPRNAVHKTHTCYPSRHTHTGLTIQRKSHVLNQEAPEHERKVEHRRPYVTSPPYTRPSQTHIPYTHTHQTLAIRFRDIHLLQHPRKHISNRFPSGGHPRPTRSSITPLERPIRETHLRG